MSGTAVEVDIALQAVVRPVNGEHQVDGEHQLVLRRTVLAEVGDRENWVEQLWTSSEGHPTALAAAGAVRDAIQAAGPGLVLGEPVGSIAGDGAGGFGGLQSG